MQGLENHFGNFLEWAGIAVPYDFLERLEGKTGEAPFF